MAGWLRSRPTVSVVWCVACTNVGVAEVRWAWGKSDVCMLSSDDVGRGGVASAGDELVREVNLGRHLRCASLRSQGLSGVLYGPTKQR